MKKLFLLSLIFILSGCNLLVNNSQPGNNSQNSEAGENIQAGEIDCQSQTISEKTDTHTISAEYPACDLADSDKTQALNQEILSLIQGEINNFKDSLKDEPSPLPLPDVVSTFDAVYTIETTSQDLISFDFLIDTYLNGAAHPNHYFKVFNYDLNKAKQIKLADLFLPNSKYLDSLAQICKSEFEKKFSDSVWFSEGCDAKEENFANFVILKDGLKFLIDPYQVAPYAAGSQELDIKYGDLSELIDPSGILANFQICHWIFSVV